SRRGRGARRTRASGVSGASAWSPGGADAMAVAPRRAAPALPRARRRAARRPRPVESSARPRIVIDVARLRETWAAEHGAPPSGAAEAALVRDAIDEEVLYREALARGFDRRDATVRERLV